MSEPFHGWDALCKENAKLERALAAAQAEAKANYTAWQGANDQREFWEKTCAEAVKERNEARAEVERLRRENTSIQLLDGDTVDMQAMIAANTALRARVAELEKYIELLWHGSQAPVTLAHVHGWRCPPELIEQGKAFRARLGLPESYPDEARAECERLRAYNDNIHGELKKDRDENNALRAEVERLKTPAIKKRWQLIEERDTALARCAELEADKARPHPIPVMEIIRRLEREAAKDTDCRWIAASELRRMEGFESRTLMCMIDTRPNTIAVAGDAARSAAAKGEGE